jgi:hypothetical protein
MDLSPWMRRLRGVRLGWARSPDGWSLGFTAQDVAWLTRALVGESGAAATTADGEAVAFSMINNTAWRRNVVIHRRDGRDFPPPHSLSDVLLAYCQPINPYFRNRGSSSLIAHRNFIASMTPGQAEAEVPGVVQKALDILSGRVDGSQYAGLVHFYQASRVEESIPEHGPVDVCYAGNCFWKVPETRSWGPDYIRIARASGSGIAALASVGVLGATASLVTSRRGLALLAALPFLPP